MHVEQVPAYVVWPVRQQVMYPEKDIADVKLVEDATGMHFALFTDNALKSVVSVFVKSDRLQFRKFATITNQQGLGYGSELLKYIIQFAKNEGLLTVWCNARISATTFYQKFGFKLTDFRFTRSGIDSVVMELELNGG